MRYVDWGGTRASVLGFGCGSVMGRVGKAQSLRAMGVAWEAGVTLFDTARSYGYGEAEGLLGEFLRGRREQAVVVTKFGILPERQAAWRRWAKPAVRSVLAAVPRARGLVRRGLAGASSAGHFDVGTMRASLEESLRQLRTEYVDALLVHEAPASVMAQEDLMAELGKVVEEGKARRVGLSPSPAVVEAAMERRPDVLSVMQFPANLFVPGVNGRPREGVLWMVNHPFGGETRTALLQRAILSMAADARVKSTLREKLQGDVKQRMAEVVFGEVMRWTGADVIVPSMLHEEHVRANVAAVDCARFSEMELRPVVRRVRAEVRI